MSEQAVDIIGANKGHKQLIKPPSKQNTTSLSPLAIGFVLTSIYLAYVLSWRAVFLLIGMVIMGNTLSYLKLEIPMTRFTLIIGLLLHIVILGSFFYFSDLNNITSITIGILWYIFAVAMALCKPKEEQKQTIKIKKQ